MKIIEYNSKYENDAKELLVELEEYILTIDEDNLDQLHPDYKDKMLSLDLEEAYKNEGICYLAIEDNHAVGLVIGAILPYDEFDYLDYKCPRRGNVTELIVSSKMRGKKVGKLLMDKIEEYFKSKDCSYVLIDVFAYNKNAIDFYGSRNYHPRMYVDIKKLD